MKAYIFAVTLLSFCIFNVPVLAQSSSKPPIDNQKQALIRELIEVLGMRGVMQQMKDHLFDMFKKSVPKATAKVWEELERRIDVEEIIELIVPLYDKYYSKEDLEGMLAFYKSPLGQRILSTLPQIMSESQAVGQEWGKRKKEELLRELKARKLLPQQS